MANAVLSVAEVNEEPRIEFSSAHVTRTPGADAPHCHSKVAGSPGLTVMLNVFAVVDAVDRPFELELIPIGFDTCATSFDC